MLLAHGLGKIDRFDADPIEFADPFGIGAGPSLGLAVFAEVGCAMLLLLGLATRFAALPLVVTMLVAAAVVHGGDPFKRQELAWTYLAAYLAIILAGPGRLSLDHLLLGWWKKRRRG